MWMAEDRRFPLGPEVPYAQLGGIHHAIYQSQAGKRKIPANDFTPLLKRYRAKSVVDQNIADWFMEKR